MVYRSLNEAAYSILRDKITRGEYALGSRIREDILAEEISMSRTPVREAVNRLVAEGLIAKKSQRGLYLIDPDPDEIEDRIDIRLSLEKLAVEKCVQRADDTDLEKISRSLTDFELALEKGDYGTCNELDGEFHLMIARMSGNDRLLGLLEELSVFFQLVRQKEKKSDPGEKNRQTLREHRNIVNAIFSRDAPEAIQAVAANIQTMMENLSASTRDTQTGNSSA